MLANITEFGKTPLFTVAELGRRGVRLVLYPLSAFRAMSSAAEVVYGAIRRDGTQKAVVDRMQTRAELYDVLGYHEYERKLDELFSRERERCRMHGHEQRGTDERNQRRGFKPKKSVALSGVPAGNTALCTVGRTGNDLHYRGYDILDIADKLRVRGGRAPADPRQAAERSGARRLQGASSSACAGCRRRCARRSSSCRPSSHPMDVMRTGVSALGCTLPEKDDHSAAGARDIADRLIASLGSMLVYWYHYSHTRPAHRRRDRGRFDRRALPAPAARRAAAAHRGCEAMHASLILYAEHEFNASTFAARVIAGTGVGHLFVHHRRDRRAARPEARRRQRGRVRDPAALRRRPTRPRRTSARASRARK